MILNWARLAETLAAAYAQELLGDTLETDTDDVLLPQLVLVLFTADIATIAQQVPAPTGEGAGPDDPGSEPAVREDGERDHDGASDDVDESGVRNLRSTSAAAALTEPFAQAPRGGLGAAPCSAVINFVNFSIAQVFDHIGHLADPDIKKPGIILIDQIVDVVNYVGRIVVAGINFVIDGAHFIINQTIQVTIGEMLSYVGKVAGIVGTIAHVASLIRPWTLHLEPEPLLVEAPNSGTAVARIDLGGLDEWPDWAQDCATRAGKPLPPLRPEGNKVTWVAQPSPYIAESGKDTQLQSGGVAAYSYTVIADPPGPGKTRVTDDVLITASIQRDDVREIYTAFLDLINAELGGTVGTVVSALVKPLVQESINQAFGVLNELRTINGRTRLTIAFGVDDDDIRSPAISGPDTRAAVDVCDLVSDTEIASILGFLVDRTIPYEATADENTAHVIAEATDAGYADALPGTTDADWRFVQQCEKSWNMEAFEAWIGPPYGRPAPDTASILWVIYTYDDAAGARSTMASRQNVVSVPGLGDAAVEFTPDYEERTQWHYRMTFRMDNLLAEIVVNSHLRRTSRSQGVEIGNLIAERLG